MSRAPGLRIRAAVLLFFSIPLAWAYEPPQDKPTDAVRSGRVAFVGRVTQLTETERSSHLSRATAVVEPISGFYGLPADGCTRIPVSFYTRYFLDEPGFSIDLPIGGVFLFVLRRPLPGHCSEVSFQSTLGDTPDLAYQLADDPGLDLERDEIPFQSAYGQLRGSTSMKELFLAARNREAETERKESVK